MSKIYYSKLSNPEDFPLSMTAAGRIEMLIEISKWTIKTGKPGRPKKMFKVKQLRKLLGIK